MLAVVQIIFNVGKTSAKWTETLEIQHGQLTAFPRQRPSFTSKHWRYRFKLAKWCAKVKISRKMCCWRDSSRRLLPGRSRNVKMQSQFSMLCNLSFSMLATIVAGRGLASKCSPAFFVVVVFFCCFEGLWLRQCLVLPYCHLPELTSTSPLSSSNKSLPLQANCRWWNYLLKYCP